MQAILFEAHGNIHPAKNKGTQNDSKKLASNQDNSTNQNLDWC